MTDKYRDKKNEAAPGDAESQWDDRDDDTELIRMRVEALFGLDYDREIAYLLQEESLRPGMVPRGFKE